MNFFNIIRKGTNKHLTALKDSAIYEIAEEKLAPKSYAELAKPLYLLSNYFSTSYHFISYLVAILGIAIYTLQLDSLVQQIVILVLSFLLLLIVEIAKSNASNTVFSSVARKENSNKLFLIVLVLTTLFSFVTSVWSAKESIYYASTNTKFSNIDSLQSRQIDSVNTLFATQISSIESSLQASQNTLQTSKNKWLKIATTKDLQDTQNSLNNILERKEKAILSITSNTQNSKDTTGEKGTEIAIFAAVLFAIFEVLNLACYWFVYQYYQSCLLENNLQNNDLVKTTSLNDIVTAPQIQSFAEPQKAFLNTEKRQSIGFQFNSQNVQNDLATQINSNSFSTDKCENCTKQYDRKTHNQRFCSSECRKENWEKANNKKLHFKARS